MQSPDITKRVHPIPFRRPVFTEVTKRIDLFQLEEHIARSMQRTEPLPVVLPEDDLDTRATIVRPAAAVYPELKRDPVPLMILAVLMGVLAGLLSVAAV